MNVHELVFARAVNLYNLFLPKPRLPSRPVGAVVTRILDRTRLVSWGLQVMGREGIYRIVGSQPRSSS